MPVKAHHGQKPGPSIQLRLLLESKENCAQDSVLGGVTAGENPELRDTDISKCVRGATRQKVVGEMWITTSPCQEVEKCLQTIVMPPYISHLQRALENSTINSWQHCSLPCSDTLRSKLSPEPKPFS